MPATATHPERSTLVDFAVGRLDDAQATTIDRHLARCAACRAMVMSVPPPAPEMPSPEAAVAAADEGAVVTEPITPARAPRNLTQYAQHADSARDDPTSAASTSAIRAATEHIRRTPRRRRRFIAASLAVLIVVLLVATAWYVSTDAWRTSSQATDSTNAADTSTIATTQQF